MMSRSEVFLTAVESVESGKSIELLGEFGSGRSYLLAQIRDHFTSIGWHVVWISGVEAFRRTSLAALSMQGLIKSGEAHVSPIAGAFAGLSEKVRGDALIVIDDSEWLDDMSWGVVSAASSEIGVPVIFSRLVHRPELAALQPISGFAPLYSLELSGMQFSELQSTLESKLDVTLEESTLSRIYAKSDGNIGLAETIIDVARRAGSLAADEDGRLYATGALWNSQLRSTVKIILSPLKDKDLHTLQTLALLGPADMNTAMKLVSREAIGRLEERSYVRIIEHPGHRTITVHPPLVVEYFRHEATPTHSREVIQRIDESLAAPEVNLDSSHASSADAATLVRLAHERARLNALKAREAWRRAPSLRTATAALRAFGADSAQVSEEINSVIAGVHELKGSDRDHAAWEFAYAAYLAHHLGEPARAVDRLLQAAKQFPDEAIGLRAQASIYEMSYDRVPDSEPFCDEEIDQLSAPTGLVVLVARSYWLVARGHATEAVELLTERRRAAHNDPRVHSLAIYAHAAAGDFAEAARIAEEHFENALNEFDGPRIRAFAYMTALVAATSRRFATAERALALAASLGVPAGETPAATYGIAILNAYFAAKRGQNEAAHRQLVALGDAGEGTLPGLQRTIVYSRAKIAAGDRPGAASLSHEAADRLWERGARLAAAQLHMDGLITFATADDWARLEGRLREVGTQPIVQFLDFMEHIMRSDVDALAREVLAARDSGRGAEAATMAQIALKNLSGEPGVDTEMSIEILRDAAAEQLETVLTVPAELSPRELEVAKLIASGLSNPRIAKTLVLSIRTVESHVNRLSRKIGARRRSDFRAYLLSSGMWI